MRLSKKSVGAFAGMFAFGLAGYAAANATTDFVEFFQLGVDEEMDPVRVEMGATQDGGLVIDGRKKMSPTLVVRNATDTGGTSPVLQVTGRTESRKADLAQPQLRIRDIEDEYPGPMLELIDNGGKESAAIMFTKNDEVLLRVRTQRGNVNTVRYSFYKLNSEALEFCPEENRVANPDRVRTC